MPPAPGRWWHGYVQGVQMGACLFLLCNFPNVLMINLTIFAEALFVIWSYFLSWEVLMVFWLLLAVKISSSSEQAAPQAYGLMTMLRLGLVEQTVFFLLVK